jgi:DNA-binding MurR/RpiR family transcriptional regulator
VLEAKDLGVDRLFSGVSFQLRRGEILGLAGLVGSGRSNVAEARFGVVRATSGQIHVEGLPASVDSPAAAMKFGMAFLTEDRKDTGCLEFRIPLPIRPNTNVSAPAPIMSVEDLLSRITAEYDGLSKQLKVIARYVEQHRDHLGLEGIYDVAAHCGVQPSAVVRFAKQFGFTGFAELQRVFRAGLSRQIAPSRNYQSRIREVIEAGASTLSPVEIAREFLSGSIAGMQELHAGLDGASLQRAVDLLAGAEAIWIAGSRRSFPIAAYLDYALQHTDKRIGLVSALGSMHQGQMRSVRAGDVLVAVSYTPYAEETIEVAQAALARGAKLIAITDSRMSPLARAAEVMLIVQENATFDFRSLTSTMGLAQALFIALAYRLELPYRSTTSAGEAPAR